MVLEVLEPEGVWVAVVEVGSGGAGAGEGRREVKKEKRDCFAAVVLEAVEGRGGSEEPDVEGRGG